MNDPKDQPIDAEEQRAWLEEYKRDNGLSWADIASRLGPRFNKSTLSLWTAGKYNAPGEWIAEGVFRFRQTLASQAALRSKGPEVPGFFETETSAHLIYRLGWAQRGRMVVCALAAGLGKTIAAKHYQACNTNVFRVAMKPSTSGLFNMQHAVLKKALGVSGASGSTERLSSMIMDRVENLTNPLLIVDEAQHLTVKAIEEIRSWHDETGLGIALLGNESVQQKLDGGRRSPEYAQIFSRLSLHLNRSLPLAADVEAVLDAWRIQNEAVAAEIHRLALLPGTLRGVTHALELGHMLAAAEQEELALKHIKEAWTQLSSQPVPA